MHDHDAAVVPKPIIAHSSLLPDFSSPCQIVIRISGRSKVNAVIGLERRRHRGPGCWRQPQTHSSTKLELYGNYCFDSSQSGHHWAAWRANTASLGNRKSVSVLVTQTTTTATARAASHSTKQSGNKNTDKSLSVSFNPLATFPSFPFFPLPYVSYISFFLIQYHTQHEQPVTHHTTTTTNINTNKHPLTHHTGNTKTRHKQLHSRYY